MGVIWHVDRKIIDQKFGTESLMEDIRDLGFTAYVIDDYNTQDFKEVAAPNVMYGTIGFCNSKYGRTFLPGVIGYQNLNVNEYYPHFEKFLLNSDYMLMPFGSIDNNPQRFLDMFAGEFFIRPVSSRKIFVGQVLNSDNILFELSSLKQLSSVMSDTICVISSAKKFEKEFRFFVGAGEIMSFSSYSWKDEPYTYDAPPEMVSTVEIIANNSWTPDIAFVADMTMYNGIPKLIEFNSVSSSGMYGCDKKEIITKISNIARKEYFS